MKIINIAIINSLGKKHYHDCLNSLKKTLNLNHHNLKKFKESKTRGHTLNEIIKTFGIKKDIMIVADDIRFSSGWYEIIEQNLNKAEIWGASMNYPNTNIIQDNGYDLVKFKGNTFLKPISRGIKVNKKYHKKDWKYVDSICGCFLYLNKKVFEYQKKFYPFYGMNRWDEFTFISSAKKKGCRVAVINNFFSHEATSTKNNKKKSYSSISYQLEKNLWSRLEKKFINKEDIKKEIKLRISNKIYKSINNENSNTLIYGAGTITENILKIKRLKKNNFTITSGLKEETKKKIDNKYKILDFNFLNSNEYNLVIITPSDYADNIFKEKFKKWLDSKWKGKIYKISEIKYGYKIFYNLKKIYG